MCPKLFLVTWYLVFFLFFVCVCVCFFSFVLGGVLQLYFNLHEETKQKTLQSICVMNFRIGILWTFQWDLSCSLTLTPIFSIPLVGCGKTSMLALFRTFNIKKTWLSTLHDESLHWTLPVLPDLNIMLRSQRHQKCETGSCIFSASSCLIKFKLVWFVVYA